MLEVTERQRDIVAQMAKEKDPKIKMALKKIADELNDIIKTYAELTASAVHDERTKDMNARHIRKLAKHQVDSSALAQKYLDLCGEMRDLDYDEYKDITKKRIWDSVGNEARTILERIDKAMPLALKYGLITQSFFERIMYPEKAPKLEMEKRDPQSYIQAAELMYIATILSRHEINYFMRGEQTLKTTLPQLEKQFSDELDEMVRLYPSVTKEQQLEARQYMATSIERMKNIELPQSNPELFKKMIETQKRINKDTV